MDGEGTISAAPGFEEIDYTTACKSGHFRHLTAANLKESDRVHALWQLRDSREMKLDLKGKVKSIRNHLGETVPVRDGVLTVSDGITYITGDGGLQVEAR